ncbi:hypothetical protein F3Y22_tig00112912pilonHSYRG00009 [Hibiscus syriacus]|uniref:Uncharacterized protein n=1 Tax=Hibiscus syriacus TaxID=106335 RepID=A0A6A2WSE1_HIBSY|nr:hypothetical protein F3Y22_tig00112912pilonHSYRG00009 [Hibiscus syriacus]
MARDGNNLKDVRQWLGVNSGSSHGWSDGQWSPRVGWELEGQAMMIDDILGLENPNLIGFGSGRLVILGRYDSYLMRRSGRGMAQFLCDEDGRPSLGMITRFLRDEDDMLSRGDTAPTR